MSGRCRIVSGGSGGAAMSADQFGQYFDDAAGSDAASDVNGPAVLG